MSMTKWDLLGRLGEGGGFDPELDCIVLNARGLPAERLRHRWGVWNPATRRWEALPRVTRNFDEAVWLCERLGLRWKVSAVAVGRYAGAVEDLAAWHGQTPAAALTRALVHHSVAEGWRHE